MISVKFHEISRGRHGGNRQQSDQRRRGAMLVLIAALMSCFLIALVFTIDVAYMQLVRTQLRVAADASTKAGMEALTRTESTGQSMQAARRVLAANEIAGRTINFRDQDVEFGRTEAGANGKWVFLPGQTPYQAMKITLSVGGASGNNEIPLIFGKVLGQTNFSPSQTSIAANLVHEIVLCLDRSHSMCFDKTGVNYSYPIGVPEYPTGYITPPSAGQPVQNNNGNGKGKGKGNNPPPVDPLRAHSRWRDLDLAIQKFVDVMSDMQIKPDIGVTTWGSSLTLGIFWHPHNGRSFPAVEIDLPLGQNLASINGVIQERYDDIMMGGTNMSAGIDSAVTQLTASGTNSLAHKTIIVMSDGQWNQGRSPLLAANDAAAKNVTIHVVSFLAGNDPTMREVANRTGGRFYLATDGQALIDAFEELARQLPVVLID